MKKSKMNNNLHVKRAKMRITQEDLANKIHVSRQTIHKIEAKETVPNVVIALKIAKFFDTTVEHIFKLK